MALSFDNFSQKPYLPSSHVIPTLKISIDISFNPRNVKDEYYDANNYYMMVTKLAHVEQLKYT